MKIVAGVFLTVALIILLVGGIAAIQQQTDIGDTVIDNTSSSYDQYEETKNTTEVTFSFLSYTPYLMMLFLMMVFGGFMIAAVLVFKAKM